MKSRTRQGRLRSLDEFVRGTERLSTDQFFIDVGFGETPITTCESFAALGLNVIGIETDQRFAAAARSSEQLPRLRFVHGDLSLLPLLPRARVIRMMNVLRAHPVEEVAGIHTTLGRAVVDGGLVIEGSSDPSGGLLTAHLLRREGDRIVREGLLFFTAFEEGFAPMMFRDWLPRDLRRRVLPGEWIHAFLAKWTDAWQSMRTKDAAESFTASVNELNRRGEAVDVDWAKRGYLLWKPKGGVPD